METCSSAVIFSNNQYFYRSANHFRGERTIFGFPSSLVLISIFSLYLTTLFIREEHICTFGRVILQLRTFLSLISLYWLWHYRTIKPKCMNEEKTKMTTILLQSFRLFISLLCGCENAFHSVDCHFRTVDMAFNKVVLLTTISNGNF